MLVKYALPLLCIALATTSCVATNPSAGHKLPKFSSVALDQTPSASTPQVTETPQAATPPQATETPQAATPPQATETPKREEPSTHVFLKVGLRDLEDDTFWNEVDRPLYFGVEVDYREPGSHLGVEFGFGFAIDAKDRGAIDTVASFFEGYGGIRFTGDMGPGNRIHPYIGAGAVAIFADERHIAGAAKVDDGDITFGGYAHIGAYYSINRHIHVGVDGRIVFGTDLDFNFGPSDISTDADYKQLSFMIGTGF